MSIAILRIISKYLHASRCRQLRCASAAQVPPPPYRVDPNKHARQHAHILACRSWAAAPRPVKCAITVSAPPPRTHIHRGYFVLAPPRETPKPARLPVSLPVCLSSPICRAGLG